MHLHSPVFADHGGVVAPIAISPIGRAGQVAGAAGEPGCVS